MNNEESQLLRYQTNATVPTVVTLIDDPMLEENVSSIVLIEQAAVAVEQLSINQMGAYGPLVSQCVFCCTSFQSEAGG